MIVEASINWGNILTIIFGAIIWLITIALAWAKFGNRLEMLELKLSMLNETVKNIAVILEKFATAEKDVLLLKTELASLQSDYAALNRTVEDLRRGVGWIQLRPRNSVDGAYPEG